jgi:TRAP-type C4-dicarboxylate transport system permease small subunit
MVKNLMQSTEGLVVKFTAAMNATATIWMFLLMFFMTADVIGRIFFGHPLTGAPELVKVSLVGVIYLHMPHTLWMGRHIRSDLLSSRMGATLRIIMQVTMHILGAALFAGIVFSSWHHMVEAWQIGEYEGEGALRVPTAPIRTIVILGSAMTVILYLVRTRRIIGQLMHNQKQSTKWTPSS